MQPTQVEAVPVSVPERRRPRLAASSLSTFGAQLGSSVLSLGNVLVVSRALGPAGRGEVVFLLAISTIVSRLAALGIQEAAVNLAVERRDRAAITANTFVFSVVLGVLGAGATAALIAVVPAVGGGVDRRLDAIALATVPLLLLNVYLWRLVQADYRFGLANLAFVLPAVINVGGNGALWLAGRLDVAVAFGTWIVGQAVSTALLVRFAVGGFSEGPLRPSVPLARKMLGFGLRSHAGRVMLLGNYRLDQWFVAALAGTRSLGLYSVAVAWAESLFLVPSALALAQRPDLVRAGRREAGEKAALAFRVGTLATAGAGAVTIAIAPWLVTTIFGEDFSGAALQLRVLILGTFGIVAVKVLGNALTAQGHPLLESAGSAVGLVLTVLFDVLLIPRHGGLGASIASVIAYTGAGLVTAVLVARTLRTPLRQLLPRVGDVGAAARALRP